MAEWIDGFFGTEAYEHETPNSTLRLRLITGWEEGESQDFKVRLRGKLNLPQLDERLSLVFSDENEDGQNTQSLRNAVDDINDNTDVAFQFNRKDDGHQRIDYRFGIRSNGKPKASVRYRLEVPYGDIKIGRLTQRIRYRGGEGVTSRTVLEQDNTLSDSRLLRYGVQFEWGEPTSGVEWIVRTQMSKRLQSKAALLYYVSMDGITRPYYITQNYGVGLSYRKQFYKDWLYYQLDPGFTWRKIDRDDGRHGVAFGKITIEAQFD